MATERPKGDIWGKSKQLVKKGAAKLAWKHPITTTATWLIGKKY